MDDQIRVMLDQMHGKAPRSKLEPHEDVIRQLRRKGHTYEEIAQFFADKLNLKVALSTIHSFVRVRARRHHRPRIELPPATAVSHISQPMISRNDEGVRQRIEELKRRRPPEPEKSLFDYDETEPLRLVHKTAAEETNHR
jgi:hypothetical protein